MPYSAITHDSRHPFETFCLAAGIVAGATAIFGGLWPSSIAEAFPFWVQIAWGTFLGGGAFIALVGIVIRFREVGIFLEQIGLVAFGGACLTYSAALLTYNFSSGFTIAFLLAGLGIASGVQWYNLEKFIRTQISVGHKVRMRRENAAR